ncbi:arylacetamide deacetylase-like isoform X2 [Dreissena polymorpha]|uniref:arylacetamide deacetylase-like isoform X2 n=1 Tax=Dreissena polymorpha TaxID=45954 RepID=UPI002264EEF9|nr:arylacetamide deacetylase-like isoform X2 [Dreissena polymorpha]
MLWRTWFLFGSLCIILVAARVYVVLHRDVPAGIQHPDVVRWLDEAGRAANVVVKVSHQLGVELATWPVKMVVNAAARLILGGFHENLFNITIRHTTVDNVPVKIFLPDSAPSTGPVPTMVYFHGGGWTWLSVGVYSGFLAHFAKLSGLQIIAVEKAPQYSFPVPLQDCLTATTGLEKRANDFRILAGKLIVAGDGAGGNLAAAVAYSMNDKIAMQVLINPALQIFDFETSSYKETAENLPGLSSAFRNVYHWLSYGGISKDYLQFAIQNKHLSQKIRQSEFASFVDRKLYLPENKMVSRKRAGANFIVTSAFDAIATNALYSPMMNDDLTRLPTLYMVTSQYDAYRDEGIMYAERLRKARAIFRHKHYTGSFHGDVLLSGYGPLTFDIGRLILEDLNKDINSYLVT